ncbi:PilT/PilU family type 4a pilus ATPase, partial [bacterium]|nr:PilT/PilU family type 4a pilus ATPase [bacterium]
LGKLGTEKVNNILASLLQIPELTYVAAEALGEIGHSSAITPLVEHIDQADCESKLAIMTALEKLKAVDAIPILEGYLRSRDREVRIKAKEVLTRLKVDTNQLSKLSEHWWEQHDLSILDTMLMEVGDRSGTELFLVSNQPAMTRLNSDLVPISKEILTENQILSMTSNILSPAQDNQFQNHNNLEFSYEIKGGGRFRGSLLRHATGINMVLRILPHTLPDLNSLNLPDHINSLIRIKSGLVLVTGPATNGKTTTVGAIINKINEERKENIITIEDPISFVHNRKNCIITQREVGKHTPSFARGLRAALREDPDIIFVSDLRGIETVSMALMAAETGHFVLATMRSISAVKTLERIIDVFPASKQDQIRTMLSVSLRAIVSQLLIPRTDNRGFAVAAEILVNTSAVTGLIRENKLFQIPSMITSGGKYGMVSMDQSLIKLVRNKIIGSEEARARSQDKQQFESYLKELGD